MDKRCENCNKKFSARNKTTRFCSEKCQYTRLNKSITEKRLRFSICHFCQKSHYVRKKDNLCKSCAKRGCGPYNRRCISCNKEFIVSIEAPNSNIYCSGECRQKGKCSKCGHSPTQLNRGLCFWCSNDIERRKQNCSKGELLLRQRVSDLYGQHDIRYNYRPQWLIRITKKTPMELDVAIIDLKIGFEFDGRVHLDKTHPGFYLTKIRDDAKTKICHDNGWLLFRVSSFSVLKSYQFEQFLREFDDEFEHTIPRSINNRIVPASILG